MAATVGVILAVFEVYLLVRWIGGPNFQVVTYGPDEPPTWMKIAVNSAQVLFPLAAAICFYRFVVLPWRRDRWIPFDGLILMTAVPLSIWDSLNSYFHTWFGYNSYFINRGDPLVELPGWQSFSEPGAQLAWPIFYLPPMYAVVFLGSSALGCMVMRRTNARWPRLPVPALVGICFVTMVVLDILMEGEGMSRLGFYDETGTTLPFLEHYYGHDPIRNMVLLALVLTGTSCLRFFRNDRGESIVERGAHQIAGLAKTATLRFFAMLAALQIVMIFGFHVPFAITTLISPNAAYHEDMVNNSYLNDHICGSGTPRECPHG